MMSGGLGDCRITEKKLANRKFREAEAKILRAFFDGDNYISTAEMAKKAGVSRSTLHRHHRRVAWIVKDYEQYILRKYSKQLKELLRKERIGVKQVYFHMLLFIKDNREGFRIVVIKGRSRWILEKMVRKLQGKLTNKLRLNRDAKKMFRVYVAEVVEILAIWGEQGFKAERIEGVLRDIMYLTEEAPTGLRGLKKKT